MRAQAPREERERQEAAIRVELAAILDEEMSGDV
jgi:hypothetical protein